MSDISVTVESDVVLEIDTTTTIVLVEDLLTELDPDGEITLVLDQLTTEITVELPTDVEIEVPGLQGPRGFPGTGVGASLVEAASTIQAFHVVALDSNGLGFQASADQLDQASYVLGIATVAALAGEVIRVQTDGTMETAQIWTPGPLFLGLNGELVSDPSLAQFQLQVAVAVNPGLLIVRPQFPIILES